VDTTNLRFWARLAQSRSSPSRIWCAR